MKVKFKRLDERATTPTRGSTSAAGYDLYAVVDEPVIIQSGETIKINTGLCMEIPDGYSGKIYPRSGLATKYGLRPANCVGVVDADYRGEVMVALHNDSKEPQTICQGDRIAQLIIEQFFVVDFDEVDELNDTDRGSGGFGSTGK